MTETAEDIRRWWGLFSLAEGQTAFWQIGPSKVWVHHAKHEWRIVYLRGDDPLERIGEVVLNDSQSSDDMLVAETSGDANVNRFVFEKSGPELNVEPALADRAVVIRPEKPLYIPKGESVTLFVSTPLWIRIMAGNPSRVMMDFPSYRPSDTWFGPSTIKGSMCYAARTSGRMHLENVPHRAHRAVTPVTIRNDVEDTLLLERFSIPVEHLSLYRAHDDFLWTDAVTLETGLDNDAASFHFEAKPPIQAGSAIMVTEPRITSKTNVLIRPFSMFFQSLREG